MEHLQVHSINGTGNKTGMGNIWTIKFVVYTMIDSAGNNLRLGCIYDQGTIQGNM